MEQGTIGFSLGHADADWATNENEYVFEPLDQQGIKVVARKTHNRKLEVEFTNEPANLSAKFKTDVPKPSGQESAFPNQIMAHVRWADGTVDLFLNGKEVASEKGKSTN